MNIMCKIVVQFQSESKYCSINVKVAKYNVMYIELIKFSCYAPNFEKVGTYWFRVVRVCVCVFMFEISS